MTMVCTNLALSPMLLWAYIYEPNPSQIENECREGSDKSIHSVLIMMCPSVLCRHGSISYNVISETFFPVNLLAKY